MEPAKPIERCVAITRESLESGKALNTLKNLWNEQLTTPHYSTTKRLIQLDRYINRNHRLQADRDRTAKGCHQQRNADKQFNEPMPRIQYTCQSCLFSLTASSPGSSVALPQRMDKEDAQADTIPPLRSGRTSALSILTDEKCFGGSLKISVQRPHVQLPILRKISL